MKKGLTLGVMAVLVIMVGGLSMGCIGTPVTPVTPEDPETFGLTAKGLQVKADVAERQARGFVQYTGTTLNVTVPEEVEVITYKGCEEYSISYCKCMVTYPDNVAGFDTPMERAFIYQVLLNEKMAAVTSISKQYSQTPGIAGYCDFYQDYYQDLQNKYQKMYCSVGNKVIGDFEIGTVEKIGNSSA